MKIKLKGAVFTRYSGDRRPDSEEEFRKAKDLAIQFIQAVESRINIPKGMILDWILYVFPYKSSFEIRIHADCYRFARPRYDGGGKPAYNVALIAGQQFYKDEDEEYELHSFDEIVAYALKRMK